jgi:hypothetical protein
MENTFRNYLNQLNIFNNYDISKINNDFLHPLVEMRYLIGKIFLDFTGNKIKPNFIEDRLELAFIETTETRKTGYKINENILKLLIFEFGLNIEPGKTFYFRNSIIDSYEDFDQEKIFQDELNIFSGLCLAELDSDCDVLNNEIKLKNYKYEIIFNIKDKTNFKMFVDFMIKCLENYFKISVEESKDPNKYTLHDLLNKCKLAEINEVKNICILDASAFASRIFKLKDERTLYTDDKRNFVINNLNETYADAQFFFNFKFIIFEFSIENTLHVHDISFWHEKDFCLNSFLNTIRDVCFNLVRCVTLIDIYTDNLNDRHSRCYRLIYQSCDRSLTHSCTTTLQNNLRDILVVRNNLKLR